MGKCVFLGIWGLEIHIFVVNVHFFPGRGQHLPGKCVCFPKSGNLCRVFKRCVEGPSAGYRMENRGRNVRKNRFFSGKNVYFRRLRSLNASQCSIWATPSPKNRFLRRKIHCFRRLRSLNASQRSISASPGSSKPCSHATM